jgi:hypothetical protein
MSAGGLKRPDVASQLFMYVSAASKGDVYIRNTLLRCLRPRSTYTVYSWRSLFTQGRGKRISANFAITEFYEVQLRDSERFSVRKVMSSSCSQPSPTKE